MPERVEILVGDTKELVDPVGEFQILKTEFSVIDANVISVDEKGIVTALKQGETTIGTMLKNEVSALTVVKVLQPVTELEVSDKTVNEGSTVKANVKVLPEGADYGLALTYSSSDETIATVNEKGTITGKKEGTVKINVISENGVEGQLTVTVKKAIVQAPVQVAPSSSGSSGSSQSSSGSAGTQTSGPTQLTDVEIAAIVAAGNAALGDKYFEGANSYGTDRNVITVNKSYDQVYNEVMSLVSRTYVAGRVFNVGSTIIVAYSF